MKCSSWKEQHNTKSKLRWAKKAMNAMNARETNFMLSVFPTAFDVGMMVTIDRFSIYYRYWMCDDAIISLINFINKTIPNGIEQTIRIYCLIANSIQACVNRRSIQTCLRINCAFTWAPSMINKLLNWLQRYNLLQFLIRLPWE